jgi:hypothetical protein
LVVDVLELRVRAGTIAHHDHRALAAVFQLIKRAAGDERRHARLHHGLPAVGKMHRALALDDVERLVGVVAMHVVLVAGIGVIVNPRVHARRAQDHGSFLHVVRQLYGIDDFDRHKAPPLRADSLNSRSRDVNPVSRVVSHRERYYDRLLRSIDTSKGGSTQWIGG